MSPSIRLTLTASWSNGSLPLRVGSRSRKSPATIRWIRRLTSTSRLRARRLSIIPMATASTIAGSRPSASARRTISAISTISSMLRPITSMSPSGSAWVATAARSAVRDRGRRRERSLRWSGMSGASPLAAGSRCCRRCDDRRRPNRPAILMRRGSLRNRSSISCSRCSGVLAAITRVSSASRHVVCCHHVDGRLPVDEAEQQQCAQEERAGDDERPAKRGRAREIRQAHGG